MPAVIVNFQHEIGKSKREFLCHVFGTLFPDSPDTFAHIVIGDFNVEDANIRWCLTNRWQYGYDYENAEHHMIVAFLEMLLEIDEPEA